jgi:hypothetical protein
LGAAFEEEAAEGFAHGAFDEAHATATNAAERPTTRARKSAVAGAGFAGDRVGISGGITVRAHTSEVKRHGTIQKRNHDPMERAGTAVAMIDAIKAAKQASAAAESLRQAPWTLKEHCADAQRAFQGPSKPLFAS